jgi:hypothetical protein
LPPRSPELNSQENIWQFMRQNWLSNRIFKSFDDIVDHCCYMTAPLLGRVERSSPGGKLVVAAPELASSALTTGLQF